MSVEGFVTTNTCCCCLLDPIIKPYLEAGRNFYKVYSAIDIIDEKAVVISKSKRVAHFFVGLLLLVPIINTIAYCIFYTMQLDIEVQREIKRYQEQQQAARKIQTCFRAWKVKKAERAAKEAAAQAVVLQQPSKPRIWKTMFSRGLSHVRNLPGRIAKVVRNSMNFNVLRTARRLTGIDFIAGYLIANSGAGAIGALRQRNWKAAGFLTLLSVGHALNSITKIFASQDLRLTMAANGDAIAGH